MNKRAWQEGYDAYGRGCPLINNPYVRLTDEFQHGRNGYEHWYEFKRDGDPKLYCICGRGIEPGGVN